MATVEYDVTEITTFGDDCHVILWEAITDTNQDGEALEMPGSADRSVQVVGTFDGTTLTIQGSNDGTNWATLTDMQGDAVTFTAAGLKQIGPITRYIRPLEVGGGTVDVDVHMLVRRPLK